MMKNLKINRKGFTLVELIVVIAILGVLMAVLVPQYIHYVEKSREGVCSANAYNIVYAYSVDAMLNENGNYKDIMTQCLERNGLTAEEIKDIDYTEGGEIISEASISCKGICPSKGTTTLSIDKKTGVFLFSSCSEHGDSYDSLKEINSQGGYGELGNAYQKALSSLLKYWGNSKKDVINIDSGGTYSSVDGDSAKNIVNAALKELGYKIGDNTLWRIAVKGDKDGNVTGKEFCLYIADLTDEQKKFLYKDDGTPTGNSLNNVSGTQVYYTIDDNGNLSSVNKVANIQMGVHSASGSLGTAFIYDFVVASRLQNRHIVFFLINTDFPADSHPFG